MGSSRPQDRSLNGGISLPQWMKGRMDTKFDFDESVFSPPSHDDSFFYIRYPKVTPENANTGSTSASTTAAASATTSGPNFRNINEVFTDTNNSSTNISTFTAVASQQQSISNFKEAKEIDFSKHPLPCQPFVPTAANKVYEPPKIIVAGKIKPKSQGTDDGFHSEPALCGKSIVHVANQIMSGKMKPSSSSIETSSSSQSSSFEQDAPKKGSKSLPVTPLASPTSTPDSSPKSRRRVIQSNRYFTGPFLPDREKYQGGWILASLLGQTRELVSAKIDEEDEPQEVVPPPRSLNRKKSISSQNLTYIGKEEKSNEKSNVYTNVFQAKPSELREMNFWSPTSM